MLVQAIEILWVIWIQWDQTEVNKVLEIIIVLRIRHRKEVLRKRKTVQCLINSKFIFYLNNLSYSIMNGLKKNERNGHMDSGE